MTTFGIITSSETENFLVRAGLVQAVVCTSMTDVTEITTKINRESPTGINSKWSLAKRGKGKRNPEPCAEVKGNFHYLFEC